MTSSSDPTAPKGSPRPLWCETNRADPRGTDMTWIQTYRGHAFSLLPDGERIYDLEDIAHALGNLCRFTGHSRRFYSVAEHSLIVADVAARNMGRLTDASERLGLFHDASEAYLGDVSRPLKQLPGMDTYRELERKIEAEIGARFGLSMDPIVCLAVKGADNALLAAEREQVFFDRVRSAEWDWLPPPADVMIEFLPPEVAATRWLCAARRALR